jgi:glycosyltransferase involved in cell wall biosynthesis
MAAESETSSFHVNMGVVSQIGGSVEFRPFGNLVKIAKSLSDTTVVIEVLKDMIIDNNETENEQMFHQIVHKTSSRVVNRIINYAWTQAKIAYHMIASGRDVDCWVFYMGDAMIIPTLAGKLTGKKVMLLLCGYTEKEVELKKDRLGKVLGLMKRMNMTFADLIIIYSRRMIESWNLREWREKTAIAHEHFIDLSRFRMTKAFSERRNVVGYIGRLAREKGILELVNALAEVVQKKKDTEILIGGDGPIRCEIGELLGRRNLDKKTMMTGWIPHDELPKYLNEVKLLVLPSYTEGLPNIVLEAMACGTPVAATSVGAIPDIISHGTNGFLLEDNSPDCIAMSILRVMDNPELEEVSRKARSYIEDNFSFARTQQSWSEMIKNVRR